MWVAIAEYNGVKSSETRIIVPDGIEKAYNHGVLYPSLDKARTIVGETGKVYFIIVGTEKYRMHQPDRIVVVKPREDGVELQQFSSSEPHVKESVLRQIESSLPTDLRV